MMNGYFSLFLGLLMVSTSTPTTTTTEPSRMAEGRMFAETMRLALKRPGVADSLGQILPFLRVMPTRQRDQLAVMIRAALRPNLPPPSGVQEVTPEYALDQPSREGGEDLLASAASPANSIVSATGEEVSDLQEMSMEGGLPAMMGLAQSARRSNSTGVLEKLLPNLDIVNLLRETVASVEDNGAVQARDFQNRFGIPAGDLRRSGGSGNRSTLPPIRRLPQPPGNNRRHSVLTSKGNVPPPNMRLPKPYDKIVRQTSQPSRRVIMGGRDKIRPPSGPSHKNHLGNIGSDSFKNHLQAQAGCRYFGPTVCLSVDYYPREAILNSIRQKKGLAEALLVNDLRTSGPPDANSGSNQEEFSVCPSEVLPTARPQKAMTKNGVWKFIVNIDDLYSQTLRMEACSRPGHPCIHVSPSPGEPFITTSCNQVRNIHKLLAWDETRGVHVDSFEIPTCCSCHMTSRSKPHAPFSMSTSYSASTSIRPSVLLNPPPSSPSSAPPKRKRPFVRGSSPAPVYEEEVEAAESSPPKRGLGVSLHPIREGLKPYRTTPTPPVSPASPPFPTTPLLPRPLSPVAVQETWPTKPAHEATRPAPEPRPPSSPVRHLPPSPTSHTPGPGDRGQSSPQRINYSYHPIFDFFRAGRLKDVDGETEEPEEAKPTEAIASERSDDFSPQDHHHSPTTYGNGWNPIIPA